MNLLRHNLVNKELQYIYLSIHISYLVHISYLSNQAIFLNDQKVKTKL